MRHPFPNDAGQPVTIHLPSLPTCPTAWSDPTRNATVVPGGALPQELGGIAFMPWAGGLVAPTSPVDEPPYVLPAGLKAAAGVVVVEDDGRVWLVAPTNRFGGYEATFPKGRVDPGTSLQHTAIREAFEESGLLVELSAWLLDARRSRNWAPWRRIRTMPRSSGRSNT